jgi:hypothetical protein
MIGRRAFRTIRFVRAGGPPDAFRAKLPEHAPG